MIYNRLWLISVYRSSAWQRHHSEFRFHSTMTYLPNLGPKWSANLRGRDIHRMLRKTSAPCVQGAIAHRSVKISGNMKLNSKSWLQTCKRQHTKFVFLWTPLECSAIVPFKSTQDFWCGFCLLFFLFAFFFSPFVYTLMSWGKTEAHSTASFLDVVLYDEAHSIINGTPASIHDSPRINSAAPGCERLAMYICAGNMKSTTGHSFLLFPKQMIFKAKLSMPPHWWRGLSA